jgi:hypothetical protein
MKILKRLAVGALVMIHADAAMLPGSETKEWPANPAAHEVKIKRIFQNEAEAALITAAENAAPDQAALRAVALKHKEVAKVVAKQWWTHEALGVKIPFALTADAISYYSDLLNGFGKQTLTRYSPPNSQFHYVAKVAKHASFTCGGITLLNVSVVTLSMNFNENFVTTTTEGMNFTKERIVIFDAKGKLLLTSGDGETTPAVLAI